MHGGGGVSTFGTARGPIGAVQGAMAPARARAGPALTLHLSRRNLLRRRFKGHVPPGRGTRDAGTRTHGTQTDKHGQTPDLTSSHVPSRAPSLRSRRRGARPHTRPHSTCAPETGGPRALTSHNPTYAKSRDHHESCPRAADCAARPNPLLAADDARKREKTLSRGERKKLY